MKIGIDISQLAFPGTGVATYTKNLVDNLLAADKRNEYRLFGTSLRRQAAIREYGKVFPFPPTLIEFVWNQLHVLPVESLIGKVDVFHSSDWTQPPTKAKKVTTVHDMVVYKFPELTHPKIVAAQRRRMEWVRKECDMVIAVSEATKKDIMEILGIPVERIKVVYEGVGSRYANFQPEEVGRVRAKYHLPEKYVLAVGSGDPRKNLGKIIKAVEILKLPETDLVLTGKLGLGYVPEEDMPGLYGGAEVFVYSSLYEGFGLPVLEAMSCHCPVVTSNVSSLPEVGGEAALYADPMNAEDIAEKIREALGQKKELVERGLRQVKKFSWKKAASETIKVYEEMV